MVLMFEEEKLTAVIASGIDCELQEWMGTVAC
jgi:hypothetical protein